MLQALFPYSVALFFVGSILPLLADKPNESKLLRQAALACTAVASLLILALSIETIFSSQIYNLLIYQITPQFQFSFQIDKLAAYFLGLVTVVSIAVSIYSFQYIEHYSDERRKNLTVSLMGCFILSMILVIASFSMFSFLFFWELMALFSFLLVMVDHEKKETRKAGMFYFIMTHLSTLFLFFAFLFIYVQTGTLNILAVRADPLITSIAFVFLYSQHYLLE